MNWSNFVPPASGFANGKVRWLLLIAILLVILKILQVCFEPMPLNTMPDRVLTQTPARFESWKERDPSVTSNFDDLYDFFNVHGLGRDVKFGDVEQWDIFAKTLVEDAQGGNGPGSSIVAAGDRVLRDPTLKLSGDGTTFSDLLRSASPPSTSQASPTSAPRSVKPKQIEEVLAEVILDPNLFDTSNVKRSRDMWRTDKLNERLQQLLHRYADVHDSLTLKERVYLNRSLISSAYPNLVASPELFTWPKLAYGLFRRMDDPSWLTILMAMCAGAIIIGTNKLQPRSGATSDPWFGGPSRIKLVFLVVTGVTILSYLYAVWMQGGTFFWYGWGHPFGEEIRVIQFVEGCLVVLCFPLTYHFAAVAFRKLKSNPTVAVKKELLRAALLPIVLVAGWSILTKLFDVVGVPFFPTPELGKLGSLSFFIIWYLPFLIMGAMAFK